MAIGNGDYDQATGKYRLQIGLDYPRRLTYLTILLAIQTKQDGKMVAIAPPKHWMPEQ
jgi:hypothetical protein